MERGAGGGPPVPSGCTTVGGPDGREGLGDRRTGLRLPVAHRLRRVDLELHLLQAERGGHLAPLALLPPVALDALGLHAADAPLHAAPPPPARGEWRRPVARARGSGDRTAAGGARAVRGARPGEWVEGAPPPHSLLARGVLQESGPA